MEDDTDALLADPCRVAHATDGEILSQSELESQTANKTQDLTFLITQLLNVAIQLAPRLQLPYVLRAKALAELECFYVAREDAKRATELLPENRRGMIAEKLVSWREKMASGSCVDQELWSSLGVATGSTQRIPIPVPETVLSEITVTDFECLLCLNILCDPVTTPCGHTCCRPCILLSVDHNRQCPFCRTSLPGASFFKTRPANQVISNLLHLLFPEAMVARKHAIEEDQATRLLDPHHLPSNQERIPIFVCSLAFPRSRLGFHIFEPRYRVRSFLKSLTPKGHDQTLHASQKEIWHLSSRACSRRSLYGIWNHG